MVCSQDYGVRNDHEADKRVEHLMVHNVVDK